MKRVFGLLFPVQFSIGRAHVLIPVSQIDPPIGTLESVECTQDDLSPGGGNWGDGEVVARAQAILEARYAGDTIEIVTGPDVDARNEAAANVVRAAKEAERTAERAALIAADVATEGANRAPLRLPE